tara:strand:+ start:193 stop:675 length:483 start_codon:yes stop_codon:yes gene_type:complete
MNKRKRNISIATSILVLGGGYLIIRSIQRNRLFKEISNKIGPGASGSLDAFDAWWNPAYCANNQCNPDGRTVIGQDDSKLNKWATTIYEAGGVVNDDEGAFYGALREMPDGVAVSLTAGKFQRKYNQDLKEYINYYLDDRDEQQTVYSILSQKPPYRIAG